MKHYMDIPKPWTSLLAGLPALASHGGTLRCLLRSAYKAAYSYEIGAAVDGLPVVQKGK